SRPGARASAVPYGAARHRRARLELGQGALGCLRVPERPRRRVTAPAGPNVSREAARISFPAGLRVLERVAQERELLGQLAERVLHAEELQRVMDDDRDKKSGGEKQERGRWVRDADEVRKVVGEPREHRERQQQRGDTEPQEPVLAPELSSVQQRQDDG